MLYFGSQRLRCNQKPLTRAPSSARSPRATPGSSQWAYHSATGHLPLLGNGPLTKGDPVCSKTLHFLCRRSHPVLLFRLKAAQALPPKGHRGHEQALGSRGRKQRLSRARHSAFRSVLWAHSCPPWVAQKAAGAGSGGCEQAPRPGPPRPAALGTGRRKPSLPKGPQSGQTAGRGSRALPAAPGLVWATSRALDKHSLLTLTPHEGLGCVDKRA